MTTRRTGSLRVGLQAYVWVIFLFVGGSFVSPAAAAAAGDANQTTCASATESSPGYRSYLPDCRAYELASPPFREGGVLMEGPAALSETGEDMILGIAGTTGGAENESYDINRGGDIDVYRLTRTQAGWQYSALTPPAPEYNRSTLMAVSADPTLSETLWGAQRGVASHKEDIYLQKPSGELTLVGPGEAPGLAAQSLAVPEELNLAGASRDLTHSVFAVKSSDQHDLWPGDGTAIGNWSLYEYSYDGSAATEPILVGISNSGAIENDEEAQLISDCGTELGASESTSTYNAVSADGKTIFFTARACAGGPAVNEIYARMGGTATVAISEPDNADCASCNTSVGLKNATYVGASENGRQVFFTTEQELFPGQSGNNLYEYNFDGPEASPQRPDGKISLVSTGSTSPDVQGVVRVSEDGSHVYFVARGVLTTGPYPAGRELPQAEADNLYVFEEDPAKARPSRVAFVARLLTEAEQTALEGSEAAECCGSGTVVGERIELAEFGAFYEALSKGMDSEEANTRAVEALTEAELTLPGTLGPYGTLTEDRSVWQSQDLRPVQATPDGRYLVFPSSADLTGAEDTSKVPQLFEYDATTEQLRRISISADGSGANGNVTTFHDAPQLPAQSYRGVILQIEDSLPTTSQFQSAISASGADVFFTSAASLAPNVADGASNVFEYSGGKVFLISDGKDASNTGTGTATVQLFGTDASGRDVFFTTANQLVPQQADSQQTLYDAREDGGFPAPPLAPGCFGETCRGAPGAAVVTPMPGSSTQPGEPAVTGTVTGKRTVKPRPPTRAQKLKKALAACSRHPVKKRSSCRMRARRRYGEKTGGSKAALAARGGASSHHANYGGNK